MVINKTVDDQDEDQLDGAEVVDVQESAQNMGLQEGETTEEPMSELDLNRDFQAEEAHTQGKIRPEDEVETKE